MGWIIYGVVFTSGALIGHAAYPLVFEHMRRSIRQSAKRAMVQLEEIFMRFSLRDLERFYLGLPLGLGALGWILTGRWYIGLLGLGVGLIVPQFLFKQLKALRQRKFHGQLVECLLLMSGSLRAGLSLLQSFSVLAEEMMPPCKDEFALLIKEMRMGVGLQEALKHLKQRMPSDDMTLFVTTVMVVRETGGNITAIFTRLVETLRERKKIRERIKTLTFMAKMQGAIMGLLPFVFTSVIAKMDPNHLKFFLEDPDGQMLLAAVVTVQLFGMVLFIRFSRSPL